VKGRNMSHKQRRFVKEYVSNGGNATQAALQAYDCSSPSVARAVGCEVLAKPYVREEIQQVMDRVGLQTEDAVKTIKDALDADCQTIVVLGQDGTILSSAAQPDHKVRLKAADMTLKLADAYPREKEGPKQAQLHQHLHVRVLPEGTPLWVKKLALSLGRPPTEQEIEALTDTAEQKEYNHASNSI